MPEKPFLDDQALSEIRAHTDWQGLFTALGITKDERRSTGGEWWGHSPFSADRTASFHMMADGRWYCFSTDQGGGVIELVQRVRDMNCYEAARWLLEAGLSHQGADSPAPAGAG